MSTKKILILVLYLIFSYTSFAQEQTNAWVNPNQIYIEFKIWEDGVYRITREHLKAINNNFITVNPKNLQVFCRGQEQYIYVHGENDFSFDSGDYIELYCKKNDGFFDLDMYRTAEGQNNPYYSQVNDTISYFVTWEDSPTPKKHYTSYSSEDYASYSNLTSVKQEKLYSYTNSFYWGQRVSPYSSGKGWFDSQAFTVGLPSIKSLDISRRLPEADINVEYSVCGAPNSSITSSIEHQVKVYVGQTLKDEVGYQGYRGHKGSFSIASGEVSGNNLSLKFTANNQEVDVDKNTLAYIRLEYERNLNFNNAEECHFKYNSYAGKQRIDLQQFGGDNLTLYNLTSGDRTKPISNSDLWSAVLKPYDEECEIHIASENKIKLANNGQQVNFQDYTNLEEQPDYLIIYPEKFSAEVQQYKAYRESKGYKVLTAEISDLYRQFAYGIEKHPLAITKFVKYITDTYQKPEYLLLVGKSVSTGELRKNAGGFKRCLIPTMGNPPSDNLLVTDWKNGSLVPNLCVGRVAVNTGEELTGYLQKVQEAESATPGIYMKRAIHFSGGGRATEQNMFKNYLKSYEDIYSDTLIGGIVSTFYKNSSDPMQTSVLDSVMFLVNNGVSLMNFFGHGSANGFDQNIEEPQNYNNRGKYPFIMANSCFSGNIHRNVPYKSISEKWVLTPEKGAIGFLASSDLGFPSSLHLISSEIYKSLSYRAFGASLGKFIHDAIIHYAQGQFDDEYVQKTIFDNTLHGDPAVPLQNLSHPDLEIQNSGIQVSMNPVTTEVDSFTVDVNYYNAGKSVTDTFLISVERTLPNGELHNYSITQGFCHYSRSVSIKMPTDKLNAVGINRLKVRLDYLNTIEELNEMNNEAEITFLVQADDVTPVYPKEFEVVPSANETLIANSGNPFDEDFTATFEIDTSDAFNSPALVQQDVETNGGIIKWELPFTLSDSTVYFWRVSKKGTNQWRANSFRYIKNQRGWSQAHHFQFQKDKFKFINYQKEERAFSYDTYPKTLIAKNIGSAPVYRFDEIGFWIDAEGDVNSCSAAPAFNVVLIDSTNLSPLLSDAVDYGHRNYPKCPSRGRADKYLQFTTTNEEQMQNFVNMLNAQPEGMHILIYTIQNGNFENLSEDVLSAFEQLNPASSVRSLTNGIPFIMYAQKGNVASAKEAVGTSVSDEINLSVNLKTNFDYGEIYSTMIGPATEWSSFHWRYKDNIDDKRTELSIWGVKNDGTEEALLSQITKDSLDVLNISQYIDANLYPYLKLQMFTKDSINKKPTQMKSWSVLYTGVPETIIDPDLGFYFKSDTVQRGEDIEFAISTQNVSPYDMDSLLVQYFVYDNQNQVSLIKSKKLRPHPSQDVLTDTVRFNTLHTEGEHQLMVEFNGKNTDGIYDQLEQNHYNNIATRNFYVQPDRINPLLNVTFDGLHIMDGDIVSASPEILIKINDDNRYLKMDDPNLVSIYLSKAGDIEEKRIEMYDSLSNQQLFWTPSSLPENVAEMLYTPQKLEDGIYTLRVGATDASKNESGKEDFKITFEVINKSTITEVLNYPNPFSSSTQFVFTLTGAELPDEVWIQIMTVTGKVVKEINLLEVSNLRIGRNITDYAWDGKDEFGDALANGVYLYRVIVRKDGEEIDTRDTNASRFFKNGIGKMYIMR